jgi:hypothetical protein
MSGGPGRHIAETKTVHSRVRGSRTITASSFGGSWANPGGSWSLRGLSYGLCLVANSARHVHSRCLTSVSPWVHKVDRHVRGLRDTKSALERPHLPCQSQPGQHSAVWGHCVSHTPKSHSVLLSPVSPALPTVLAPFVLEEVASPRFLGCISLPVLPVCEVFCLGIMIYWLS